MRSALFAALDPVRLLRHLQLLQEARWRHAVVPQPLKPDSSAPARCRIAACGLATEEEQEVLLRDLARTGPTRTYHRSPKTRGPRTYRTRPDPFAEEWEEIQSWVARAPERTAKSIFQELQHRDPARHPAGQLRTLQRRIKELRAKAILAFSDGWLAEDAPLGVAAPAPATLRLRLDPADGPAAR